MKTLNIEEFASSKESKFQAAYGNLCQNVTELRALFSSIDLFLRLIDRLVASFRSHLRVIVTYMADR